MTAREAYAKINLGLVVGPMRDDGKHEVVTLLQRVSLHDTVMLEAADTLQVVGYAEDTIVTSALESLGHAAGVAPAWRVTIEKRIPVAAGLGGGSSDAASALVLANAALASPLALTELHDVARSIGADVPFFLHDAAMLGTADGTELTATSLPSDFAVLLVLPHDAAKDSTATVYEAFEARRGWEGFDERRGEFMRALAGVSSRRDLASLPANDLASSPLVSRLRGLGAFRADVSGAGPVVYGLFDDRDAAERARDALDVPAQTWTVDPV